MNVVLRLTEAAVEFLWWWGGVGLGLHSPFHVPPPNCVEVVLRFVVVWVVTIFTPGAVDVVSSHVFFF